MTQARITEVVYAHDNGDPWQLFRVVGITDRDGTFFARCDQFNPESAEWQPDFLTQFQRDTAEVHAIAAPGSEVLEWFGFDFAEIVEPKDLEPIAGALEQVSV